MFGKRLKPKSQCEKDLEAAQVRVAQLESQHKALVAEKEFWKEQGMAYSEQVAFWMTKHREILAQSAGEGRSLDLRAYAKEIEQALIDARPDASLIAAVLAMAGKDVQGVFTLSPRERSLLEDRKADWSRLNEVAIEGE